MKLNKLGKTMQKLLNCQSLGMGIALSCTVVLTSLMTTITPALAQKTQEEILIAQSIDEANNIKFESPGCRRTQPKEVICDVLITNMSKERKAIGFRISNSYPEVRSNAIDSSGTVYASLIAQSGGNTDAPGYGGFQISLIPDLPTKVTFTFEIPPEVSEIAALDVGYYGYQNDSPQALRIAIPKIGTIK